MRPFERRDFPASIQSGFPLSDRYESTATPASSEQDSHYFGGIAAFNPASIVRRHASGETDASTYLSSRPNTARPSVSRASSRPTTASGRRSRATGISSVLGFSESQDVIVAVSEGRGISPSVGIAIVNLTLSEVALCQICDNRLYTKTIHNLQIANPSRIIFMNTAHAPERPHQLSSLVERLIPEATLVTFDRSAWSETDGMSFIESLAFQSDIESLNVAIDGKFYATSSFSAAMMYIEQNFNLSFAPHSLRIKYQSSDGSMMIDISAIQSLEIMQSQRDPKSKQCLFGLLNHTCTAMGSRMLRANILQPPTDKENFIERRYEALEELTQTEEMFREIRKALKNFHDIQKTLTKIVIIPKLMDVSRIEEQLSHVLVIKSFLEATPQLYRALVPAKSPLLTKCRNLCRPEITRELTGRIHRVIEPDVTFMKSALDLRNQRTFAVKSGISGMLDMARQTYKELTYEIHRHVEKVNEETGVNATLRYDNSRKYWLRFKESDLEDPILPKTFVNVVRKRGTIECQTLDLVKLNLRLSDTSNEVVIRSDAEIQGLVDVLRSEVQHLFRISESVALVDMMCSFGQLTTTQDYVRPQITGTLALKSARHPILSKALAEEFVPNDYYATHLFRFHIVTGCNMSGKSIYIRTVPLLQIMAQIGCFVPAEFASFAIVHNIFVRVSLNDNIESNLSTFSVEMRDMAFILRNIDEKSIAIIDELGRGTSTRDGLAIAVAMAEALIHSKAGIWFATHFIELAQVLADRPGVLNLHLAAESSLTGDGLPQITMLYKTEQGSLGKMEHYGIDLARAMGFSSRFVEKAEAVASDLRLTRESRQEKSEFRRLKARRRLVMNLHEALQQARDSGSEAALPGYLRRLQAEFIVRMEEVANL